MALIWAVSVVTGGVTPCAGSPSMVHCAGVFVLVVCVCFVRESVLNFWCECVQCLRGGVRFPNEVGVWWPSVYGGPNPKALHFQPWVGLGL